MIMYRDNFERVVLDLCPKLSKQERQQLHKDLKDVRPSPRSEAENNGCPLYINENLKQHYLTAVHKELVRRGVI